MRNIEILFVSDGSGRRVHDKALRGRARPIAGSVNHGGFISAQLGCQPHIGTSRNEPGSSPAYIYIYYTHLVRHTSHQMSIILLIFTYDVTYLL